MKLDRRIVRQMPPAIREEYEKRQPSRFFLGLVYVTLLYVVPVGAKLGWSGFAKIWTDLGAWRWLFLLPLLVACHSVVYYRQAVHMSSFAAWTLSLALFVLFVLLLIMW